MNRSTVSVLLVDKTKENFLLIDRLLNKIITFQITLDSIETEAELNSAIASQKYDAYLIDSQFLARIDRAEISKIVVPVSPNPVIVITDNDEEGIAAIEAGAADYLVKNELTVSMLERSLRLTLAKAKSDRKLQQSKSQLQLLVDALPVCIAYIDVNQKYRFTNQSYRDWFGYQPEDIHDKSIWEVIGEESYQILRGSVNRVLEGELITYEAKVAYPEGERDIIVALVPDFARNSQVRGYYTIVNDISLRKQAEEKLQYRLLLEKTLAQVSRKLACDETVDFQQLLGWLGIAVGSDRVYLKRFCDDRTGESLTQMYYWWDSHTKPHSEKIENLEMWQFLWWMEKLKSNQNIVIANVDRLPETAAAEKKLLQSFDICSMLAVPIYDRHSQLWGTIGLDTRNKDCRDWLEEDAQLLRIVGEMIYTYSERLLAQEQLRASEALYAGIFNHSADAIFLLDVLADDRFVYETINPAYQQATGLSKKDIIGKTVTEVLPKEIASLLDWQYRVCIAAGKPINYEHSLKLSNSRSLENNDRKNEISAHSKQSSQQTIAPENKVDRHRTWLTTVVPIRDGTGKIVKLQGSARDISEEKQAIAEQIRHTRHRYLLKSVTLKIRNSLELEKILKTTVTELQKTVQADRVLLFHFLEDGSGKVIEEAVVPNFPVMQGITMLDRYYRDNLQHKYTEGYVHTCNDTNLAEYPECYRQFLNKYQIRANLILPILRRSVLKNFSHQRQQKDNSLWGLLCVQQCSQARQWKNEEIELLQHLTGQLSIALSQAELLKQKIVQSQELARSNAELEQFAYVASHDLQAPLHTISSYAKLLERQYSDSLDAKTKKFIDYIVDGAQRMRDRINDLLEYSRVGRQKNTFYAIDCNRVLEQVLADLNSDIKQAGVVVKCEGNLPTIVGDPKQLILLLQNLIGNSIKYRTQETPTIKIAARRDRDFWQFSITDNGIGIEPQYHDRIFQIFQRLHAPEEYPGTGIGLAICQKIVERHGGSIWVESNPDRDRGATFHFTIPV
ncbi:MAG: GAF domain-containing protein [Xenococcaceae cyanobacterium]